MHLVYTTACRVGYAVLLTYINDICELAMFDFFLSTLQVKLENIVKNIKFNIFHSRSYGC